MKAISKWLIGVMILTVMIALPFTVSVGQDIGGTYLGGSVGLIMEQDMPTEFSFAVVGNLSTDRIPVVGQIATKVEGSYINSDRSYKTQTELNVLRLFTIRQFRLSEYLFVGFGSGYWHIIDSDGPDDGHFATRFEFGFRVYSLLDANMELAISMENVRQSGPDMWVPQISLILF